MGRAAPATTRSRATRGRDEEASDERERAARRAGGSCGASRSPWSSRPAGWGVVPGLTDAAAAPPPTFVDTRAYAVAVLDGGHPVVSAPALAAPALTAYLYAAASLAGALGVAAAGLAGAGGRLPGAVDAALGRLRSLHDGRPADYVTWLAVGATVLCATFALTLR